MTSRYTIYCSFLMDSMMISFFTIWFIYWKSFRMVITYLIFFGTRGIIQGNFLMPRYRSYLFHDPGFPSLTVPYHDSSDFYFSGHLGTCFILVLETRTKGWYRFSGYCIFVLLNQWFFMIFTRSHYLIDMVTGIIVAHYAHMIGERVSWLVDCKIMRMHLAPKESLQSNQFSQEPKDAHSEPTPHPNSNKREAFHFKACDSCGWSNKRAKHYLPREEQELLKLSYQEHLQSH